MKIALLIDSMDFGGSERSAQILANILAEQRYIVSIFSLANIWNYPLDRAIGKNYVYDKNYSFFKKIVILPYTFRKVKQAIADFGPEVIISLTPQANILNFLLGRLAGYKTISSERQFAEDYYGRKNIIARPIISMMHNGVDAVIVNDVAIKESLQVFYKVARPIFVLNNLFDENVLLTKHKIRRNDSLFRFITIGRLSREKNTRDLILAFSKVAGTDNVLQIIGDGTLREELENLAANLGIGDRVQFLGHQNDPFTFLAEADAFVFSSLNEGFPNVILEAMSCGLPVISYHFKSGINTILEDGKNGILVELGNVTELTAAMEKLKSDVALQEHLSERSLITIKKFSDKARYLHEFEKILTAVV